MHKKILALNSSKTSISIALLKKCNVKNIFSRCKNDHSQKILPMLKTILLLNNVKMNEIYAIAFNKGPGNFTSTRIIVNVAIGLSLGKNIPLISISYFNIIAEKIWKEKKSNKIIFLHNTIQKIYWTQCIRNTNNIWKVFPTEIFSCNKLIIHKFNTLIGTWIVTGNICLITQLFISKKKLLLHYYPLKKCYAKDIIPIALTILKLNQTITPNQAIPSYFE